MILFCLLHDSRSGKVYFRMNYAVILSQEEGRLSKMESSFCSAPSSVIYLNISRLYPLIFPAIQIHFLDPTGIFGTDATLSSYQKRWHLLPLLVDFQHVTAHVESTFLAFLEVRFSSSSSCTQLGPLNQSLV